MEALRGRCRGWDRRGLLGGGSGSLVAAFLVGALPGDAGALQVLLDQVVGAASRAWMRDDFVPGCEFTFRIAAASEENLSAAAATLEDLAFLAFRTRDPGLRWRRLQALDSVALRIPRASQKFAKARAPLDHRLAALLADFIGRHGRRRRLERDNPLVVARDLSGVGAFGVVRAGDELAVELAFEPGGQALALDLGHFILGLGKVLGERAVKAPEGLHPVLGALFHLVE